MVIFGTVFVGIIIICLGITIVSYIVEAYSEDGGRNEKLIKNMKKLDESNRR